MQYYMISNYSSFVESIELLLSHLKSVLRGFFGRRSLSVHGAWAPGPALVRAEAPSSYSGPVDATKILLWYLILSHAALLALFIWKVLVSDRYFSGY